MFITDALALSIVPRWAIVRAFRHQSVAEHSFNVAMITRELLTRYDHLTIPERGDNGPQYPTIRPYNVIWLALTHDIEECVTGDIPRHAKHSILRMKRDIVELVPDLPQIGFTLQEHNLVKLADIMEAATWIRMNGVGRHAEAVADRLKIDLMTYIDLHKEMLVEVGHARQLYHDIVAEAWRAKATGAQMEGNLGV